MRDVTGRVKRMSSEVAQYEWNSILFQSGRAIAAELRHLRPSSIIRTFASHNKYDTPPSFGVDGIP